MFLSQETLEGILEISISLNILDHGQMKGKHPFCTVWGCLPIMQHMRPAKQNQCITYTCLFYPQLPVGGKFPADKTNINYLLESGSPHKGILSPKKLFLPKRGFRAEIPSNKANNNCSCQRGIYPQLIYFTPNSDIISNRNFHVFANFSVSRQFLSSFVINLLITF